ncbi:MAG: excinuclease ABC subunit UvrA [Bacteroidaceae bacterium]|nr:excinuclease ABC subunit UvrA [Bacteroidaceae bacterium]
MNSSDKIELRKVRVNNLKNISLEIPRDRFIVITGLSGSGKSSLAFDTLYAEGQRRYVESLSAYARQFLGRMKKPECDYILGLPPTIAIGQHTANRNPRSTVGTQTEIYEYLKLLYSRVGKTISPVSGQIVKRHYTEDIIQAMLEQPERSRFTVLAPLTLNSNSKIPELLKSKLQQGYTRIDYKSEIVRIEDVLDNKELLLKIENNISDCFIVIDRLSAGNSQEIKTRLSDSADTAFYEENGTCLLRFYSTEGNTLLEFSNRFEADGIKFEEPTEQLFSFNSPLGACPVCEGYGKVIGIDESLVIPNRSLSIYDGAVVCWRGEKMGEWRDAFIMQATQVGFPIFKPYYELTEKEKDYLWHGTGKPLSEDDWECSIDNFFSMVERNQYKIQYRVMLSRYRGKTICPECHGTRLRKEASYVKVGEKSITELIEMPIGQLSIFFRNLELSEHEYKTARRILTEIERRLSFMMDVGLEYLTLNRASNTLSGGESQRISLVTSLGSSLVGSLYILDEPSIGLHSRDTDRLIKVLKELKEIGNTVIVVEHDEDIIRAADYIIDVGPEAGRAGGNIVYQGDINNLDSNSESYTIKYLTGKETIPLPYSPRYWNNSIQVKGARQNNLKGIDVKFPLNVMTVVTGVSGSGKSTLVREILYLHLKNIYSETSEHPGECISIEGDINMAKGVEFVDQNPIGKSSRSNPVSYIKAYDEIRKLFADQPLSKQMGFKGGHFSFNSEGGRCEECKGEGTITISMQFMSDLRLECDCCHGKRFKNDILEVTYKGCNIWDVLNMTVNQAIEFFNGNSSTEKKIVKKLDALRQVGLGYIKLGQSSSTLSGGESQRVKLAYYLSLEKSDPTIFIFDEPTTGLHFHDIKKLLESFNALIERGHTIIVIEHNMDVIKCADYIVDLGPEGGDKGGTIIATGTPKEISECPDSYTGHYLKRYFE